MKKLLLILMLIMSISSYSKVGIGLGIGSETEVVIGIEDINIGIGLESDTSFRLDKHFTIPGTPHFYWGLGGKYSEDDRHEIGVRGIAGLNFFPVKEVELYAQVIPTLYLRDDTHTDVEFSVGFKYWLN